MLTPAEATVGELRALTRSRKYNNNTVYADGHCFDSGAEYARYQELRLLERAGKIANLKVHPRYEVLPTIRYRNGKVLFRKTSYELDFAYTDVETGETVCEDVKGFETKDWRLKAKLFLARYGDEVRFEVIPASAYHRSGGTR